ncbi:glycine amidinotransferase [Aphanizomenon sp. CS-733/32]|uniref:glycine amidinotransferase n=1 Tax=Aphanizomenon sp. CS-733/32 TaxID=3021715 RepID=UPI00232AE78F|nr:glycine amidinotransferase [Aphanizomenon sp. CS-733/32]MDB9310439.1 glycine amidinotransferase [Aphanizomenon sp. CS-733/32]
MVNSFDEWSRLKEVVVGSPINYNTQDLELSFKVFFHDVAYSSFCYPYYYSGAESRSKDNSVCQENSQDTQTFTTHSLKKQYLQELNEDVEELVSTLQKLGIKVHRPIPLTRSIRFETPYWKADCIPALNIRDQAIIMGNEILETPPQVRARYFENDLLKQIFYKYFEQGAKWTNMPKPIMTDRSFDTSYISGQNVPAIEEVYPQNESEFDIGYEIMFDAAQCIRFGKDILINVATKNHYLAYQWLQRHFEGKFNFHLLYQFADNHIDSIILPLKPGKLLLRNPQFFDRLPEPLKKWDIIYPPEPTENIFPTYDDDDLILTTKYIDLNVLSVDEDKIIVNSLFPELIKTLEKHGFTAIPVQHRHRRIFGGGFHCFTLDTVREGSLEDYFS